MGWWTNHQPVRGCYWGWWCPTRHPLKLQASQGSAERGDVCVIRSYLEARREALKGAKHEGPKLGQISYHVNIMWFVVCEALFFFKAAMLCRFLFMNAQGWPRWPPAVAGRNGETDGFLEKRAGIFQISLHAFVWLAGWKFDHEYRDVSHRLEKGGRILVLVYWKISLLQFLISDRPLR